MITPNKFVTFDDSILRKLQHLLSNEIHEITIPELYKKHKRKFENIDQFIYCLDVLHILGKIEIDFEIGVVKYVD